jgi:hypothetical protein
MKKMFLSVKAGGAAGAFAVLLTHFAALWL